MITEDGFCTLCRGWVLQMDGLRCPGCLSQRESAVLAWLDLSPIAEPEKVLQACKVELRAIAIRRRQVIELRSRAARAWLARFRGSNLTARAKDAHLSLAAIERYAEQGVMRDRERRAARPKVLPQRGPEAVARYRDPANQAAARDRVRAKLERREEIMRQAAEESTALAPRLLPPLGEPEDTDFEGPGR